MKLIKFGAAWCQPCKSLSSVLASIQLPGELEEVDIDEHQERAAQHNIRNVPTLIVFDNAGNEVGRMIGAKSASQVNDFLDTL